jgi:hypothetical protein
MLNFKNGLNNIGFTLTHRNDLLKAKENVKNKDRISLK